MSAPGTRPSAIARIRALLSQPTHPYRPATTVFLDLSVDRVADELRLAVQGSSAARRTGPSSDAQTWTMSSTRSSRRSRRTSRNSNSIYLDHLHTYDERLTALSFEERFATIQQAAPEAVGDFRAEATIGRDDRCSCCGGA